MLKICALPKMVSRKFFSIIFRPPIDTNSERMIIRTFLKLKHGGKEVFEVLPNGQRRQFQDLMSHRSEMVLDSDIMSVVANVYANIKNIMNGKNHPTKSEVLEIYGKNRINQIYIYTKNITKVGFGVYLGNFAFQKNNFVKLAK